MSCDTLQYMLDQMVATQREIDTLFLIHYQQVCRAARDHYIHRVVPILATRVLSRFAPFPPSLSLAGLRDIGRLFSHDDWIVRLWEPAFLRLFARLDAPERIAGRFVARLTALGEKSGNFSSVWHTTARMAEAANGLTVAVERNDWSRVSDLYTRYRVAAAQIQVLISDDVPTRNLFVPVVLVTARVPLETRIDRLVTEWLVRVLPTADLYTLVVVEKLQLWTLLRATTHVAGAGRFEMLWGVTAQRRHCDRFLQLHVKEHADWPRFAVFWERVIPTTPIAGFSPSIIACSLLDRTINHLVSHEAAYSDTALSEIVLTHLFVADAHWDVLAGCVQPLVALLCRRGLRQTVLALFSPSHRVGAELRTIRATACVHPLLDLFTLVDAELVSSCDPIDIFACGGSLVALFIACDRGALVGPSSYRLYLDYVARIEPSLFALSTSEFGAFLELAIALIPHSAWRDRIGPSLCATLHNIAVSHVEMLLPFGETVTVETLHRVLDLTAQGLCEKNWNPWRLSALRLAIETHLEQAARKLDMPQPWHCDVCDACYESCIARIVTLCLATQSVLVAETASRLISHYRELCLIRSAPTVVEREAETWFDEIQDDIELAQDWSSESQ